MKDMFKDVLEFLLDQTSKVGLRFILSSFIILPDPSPWIVLRLCF